MADPKYANLPGIVINFDHIMLIYSYNTTQFHFNGYDTNIH